LINYDSHCNISFPNNNQQQHQYNDPTKQKSTKTKLNLFKSVFIKLQKMKILIKTLQSKHIIQRAPQIHTHARKTIKKKKKKKKNF